MNDSHLETFRLRVNEIFALDDGRTVLAGRLDAGEDAIIQPGRCKLFADGQLLQIVEIEPELLFSRRDPMARRDRRAVATSEKIDLPREKIEQQEFILEGQMRVRGHRHLVGIDSPPHDYVPDTMTLGPRLPDGWDGDAWMAPDESGYFLRAWNKEHALSAVAQAETYQEARQWLLDNIRNNPQRVVVHAEENV